MSGRDGAGVYPKLPRADGGTRAYLLVDGYNIIFAWDELRTLAEDASLEDARDRLVRVLANYQGAKGMPRGSLIVVFDAHKVKGNAGSMQTHGGLCVVYTAEAETADHFIERTTANLTRQRYTVTVATSDSLEQVIIMGNHALRLSARELHMDVLAAESETRAKADARRPVKNNQMMEHFDEELLDWFEAMRRKT